MQYSEQNPRLYSPEFTAFISSLLKRANLNDINISLLTSEKCLEKFRAAFTHKSISREADVNYELLEIVGDAFINNIVVRYIRRKFPRVVNVMWITKLKHYLISKGWLSLMAEKYGFLNYIWMSDELSVKFNKLTQEEKHADDKDKDSYLSILEDTMESFIGALVENVDEIKGIPGPDFTVATLIIYSFFDEAKIELDFKRIFDPKTRIKELFERKGGHGTSHSKWKFAPGPRGNPKVERVFNPDGTHMYKVEIYGFPLGDMSENRHNSVLLGIAEHRSQRIAEYTAYTKALEELKKYGIEERPYNPYKRTN